MEYDLSAVPDFYSSWDLHDSPMPPLWCDMTGASPSTGHIHDPHPISTLEVILEGQAVLDYRGGSHVLNPGDVALLASGEWHRLMPANGKTFRKIFVTLTGACFVPLAEELFGSTYLLHPEQDELKQILQQIELLRKVLRDRKSAVDVSAAVYTLLLAAGSCIDQLRSPVLGEVLRYMEQHISEPVTVKDLARQTNLPLNQLQTLFKKHFQMTPAQYFLQMRLKKGAELLLGSKLTVKEIAMMTGYNSGLAFAREFQKNYGVRPSLFRKQGT